MKDSKVSKGYGVSEPQLFHEKNYLKRLKGLMYFRVLFAFMMGLSAAGYYFGGGSSQLIKPLLLLLWLSAALIILSAVYFIVYRLIGGRSFFAYTQFFIDTIIITLIILITGGLSSIFTILYLVVIMCASMILYRKGSTLIATLCTVQFILVAASEYYGILSPVGMEGGYIGNGWQILYKVPATVIACYAVAFLGGILAEQEKNARKELKAMEDHLKRVKKTAAAGEMAAGLAHEIKNPLASLTGSIQLLREDENCDPDNDKLMQIILREADRLNTLVTDFLFFAKPQIGKSQIFKLDSALMETVVFFEKDTSCRGRIFLEKKFIPDIWIEMDQGHLRQIMWNLLKNASEAISGNGTISIEIDTIKDTHAIVTIRDNGCGIPEENTTLIFNPFFTTRSEGTGLGLSIVQRILAGYDARLDVDSQVDTGTTFTLRLKRVANPAGASN